VTAFLFVIGSTSRREVYIISRLRREQGGETDVLPFHITPRLFHELNAYSMKVELTTAHPYSQTTSSGKLLI
jgi:hypothetical protein